MRYLSVFWKKHEILSFTLPNPPLIYIIEEQTNKHSSKTTNGSLFIVSIVMTSWCYGIVTYSCVPMWSYPVSGGWSQSLIKFSSRNKEVEKKEKALKEVKRKAIISQYQCYQHKRVPSNRPHWTLLTVTIHSNLPTHLAREQIRNQLSWLNWYSFELRWGICQAGRLRTQADREASLITPGTLHRTTFYTGRGV